MLYEIDEIISINLKDLKHKNDLLWRFTLLVFPFAQGELDKYVDVAIEQAEYLRKKETK